MARGLSGRAGPVAALLAVLGLLAGCSSSARQSSTPGGPGTTAPSSGVPYGYHGLRPSVPLPRPAFVLHDTSGARYAFAERTAGRPTLLYFGYTHCPDACPTTMADVAAALRHVDPRVARAMQVVFVTTDPRRDTGPVLRAWLDRFDATLPVRFVGLVGTSDEVHAAERAAGVPLSAPETDGAGGYAVAHAALLLAYAVDDRAHVLWPEGTTVATYEGDLPRLLSDRQPG